MEMMKNKGNIIPNRVLALSFPLLPFPGSWQQVINLLLAWICPVWTLHINGSGVAFPAWLNIVSEGPFMS